jgi:signal transduction histidine kinase
MGDIRRYINDLSEPLSRSSLADALQQITADFEANTGIPAAVEVDVRLATLNGATADELLQIVREALSNVSKHADASHVHVSLREEGEGGALLRVEDDGRGIAAERMQAAVTGHYGLSNMRDRARSLGGTFEVTSEAGRGTAVQVQIPPAEVQHA